MQAINIGLLGLGTVGGGVAEVLRDNQAEIARRLGRQINITAVCDLNAERAAQLCPQAERVANPMDLVQRADVDIVVELFGGTGIAKEAVLKAIENGKHVVTANKKLLAEYGNEIFALAEQKNVMVQFEAAVAGGIPVLKALREGLAANPIHCLHHQRHQQLYFERNARKRQCVQRCAGGSATLRLCRSRPDVRYRRARCRP